MMMNNTDNELIETLKKLKNELHVKIIKLDKIIKTQSMSRGEKVAIELIIDDLEILKNKISIITGS